MKITGSLCEELHTFMTTSVANVTMVAVVNNIAIYFIVTVIFGEGRGA
jgi:hypothetical protein